jgi:tRNA A-37 threonylcarbamoyl transferase component Bud32
MAQPIIWTSGGYRWEVASEICARLLGPDGLRLPEWLAAGLAEVVKQGPQRVVYRVRLPGLCFYVKHNRVPNLRTRLRGWLRPAKARIESGHARAVAARGIPTAELLAFGEPALPGGESFLVTRSLDDTVPLNAFLSRILPTFAPRRQGLLRRRLARELGRFVGRMHDQGVLHDDLHMANLVLRLGPDDSPQLFLLDLYAVRLRRPLGWKASRDNLVLINSWCVLCTSRSDRLRFWRAYCRARGWDASAPPSGKTWPRQLEAQTWAWNNQRWRLRDQRCRRSNRYYQRVASAVVQGHAVRDLDRGLLDQLLADPEAPFRRPDARPVKDTATEKAVELRVEVGDEVRRLVYRRLRPGTWGERLNGLLHGPAALRWWVLGHGLRERGLPAPRPLAVLWPLCGPAGVGYLLTEQPPTQTLAEYLEGPGRGVGDALRGRIDQVARLVRELHRRGVLHGELTAGHILLTPAGTSFASSAPASDWAAALAALHGIWLDGLSRARCSGPLSHAERVAELARLHADLARHPRLTRGDRLRFLRLYLHWSLCGRGDWKTWWRQIDRAAGA